MTDAELPVHVGPLGISALTEPLPANVSHAPNDVVMMFLEDLLEHPVDALGTLRQRYSQISDPSLEPNIVPDHPVIMQHIVRPLKEAKQCYVLGMPVACIAQAGLVGEMVALWRFSMLQPRLDGRLMGEDIQKLIFGREFDRLGQEERVRVLRAIDQLDDETIQAFGELRSLRRQYLHYMVSEKNDKDGDAQRALGYANTLVVRTLDFTWQDGKIDFPPKVFRYIQDIIRSP